MSAHFRCLQSLWSRSATCLACDSELFKLERGAATTPRGYGHHRGERIRKLSLGARPPDFTTVNAGRGAARALPFRTVRLAVQGRHGERDAVVEPNVEPIFVRSNEGLNEGLHCVFLQTPRCLGVIRALVSCFVIPFPFGLITQRSVVQIHPPQPTPLFGFNGLSQSQELAR